MKGAIGLKRVNQTTVLWFVIPVSVSVTVGRDAAAVLSPGSADSDCNAVTSIGTEVCGDSAFLTAPSGQRGRGRCSSSYFLSQ